jgi:hypothetical protein
MHSAGREDGVVVQALSGGAFHRFSTSFSIGYGLQWGATNAAANLVS